MKTLKDLKRTYKELGEEIEKLESSTKEPLRYANGALMEIPEGVETVYKVWFDTLVGEWEYEEEDVGSWCCSDREHIYLQDYFLTEKEAKDDIEMRDVQYDLLRKIAEIHIEEGWACEWNNEDQEKFCLSYDKDICDFTFFRLHSYIYGTTVLSENSKDYLLSDKVSDKERKLFLGIKK